MQPPDCGAPYLSIVAAAPSGDASPDLPARVQLFVDSWINQARRHRLDSELIIVAQDPPALRWPQDSSPCEIRILDIPRETQIRGHPANQRLLINAGIRRARGEFVLATNIDVVFSSELIEFLASQRLEQGRMYRVDRYDVEPGVPSGATPDERLAYCCSHLMRVSAREGVFPVTPAGLRLNAQQDIASINSGLSFGSGWFSPEHYAATGETFRWIDNDAEILASVPERGGILILEAEPGPGLGPLPQTLQILDDCGSVVAGWTIDGRTTTALAVPPTAPGALRKFRLHLPGGGAPVLDDPRILNLAVFRCDWVAPDPPQSPQPSLASAIREHSSTLKRLLGSIRKFQGSSALLKGPLLASRSARLLARRGSDIFEAGMDFELGPGWYYREQSGDDRFRWVSKDARFLLRMPQSTSTLAMLVEPGPAQERVVLVVRSGDECGEVLTRTLIQGLTYLEFTVPAAPGTIAPLCLTPETPGSPAGRDSRLLSFRVFACGAGKRSFASSPNPRAWLTLNIDSKPATKDWTSRREASPQLLEMGQPAYLHTNTCADFTLMARSHWFDLRGYSELDLPADHLDSLFCYAAHHAGAREQGLEDPLRIYRAAPSTDPSNTPAASPQLQSALHDDLLWLIANMRALHVPVIFNRADWGLADHELSASGAHS